MLVRLMEVLLGLILLVTGISSGLINPQATLECHRREYTYTATRTDSRGRQCWDSLTVMSCWGRCDSGEIADWRFPFKKSFHPVCIHERKRLVKVILQHCDPDADPELRIFEYYEADTCACQICESSTASCESVPYRSSHLP
ncbi:thyrostimulin beta-5 subunit-like [Tachypleus tridentatus]|uniref:thyrostimulin beta-5 subunit-like n=1 Tax=Tachypleus tridentatus TaxID=6853 RepID=UPI003FCF2DCF